MTTGLDITISPARMPLVWTLVRTDGQEGNRKREENRPVKAVPLQPLSQARERARVVVLRLDPPAKGRLPSLPPPETLGYAELTH